SIALNVGVTINGLPGDTNSLATLLISGATAGAILTDGTNSHTFAGPTDSYDIHSWNLASLTIKPANDTNFTLNVAATEKDAAGDLSTTTNATAAVTVKPKAPTASWTSPTVSVNEGSAVNIPLSFNVNGLTGDSNTLKSVIVTLPNGATISDGTNTKTAIY